jgi:putative ABC transport system permease protein
LKPLAFAARSLRREFRHGELATLAAALVLAVAALAAIGTLAARVERAMLASAAELVGGDLGISARQSLGPEFAAEASRRDLGTAALADFPSVVFAGEHSVFCEIRASDAGFPLRGSLVVRDATGRARSVHAPPAGSLYADHRALVALDAGVGAVVQVGGRDLVVAGEIVQSPDGGELVQLAPRVLMALADAEAAGLLGEGSRARHRLLVAGDADAVAGYAAWAEAQALQEVEVTSLEDARENLRRAFDRGESFLRLAAMLAALLAGIAIALSAQRFARRKTDEVALLRCLGASRGEILATLAIELGLLALPACALGLGLGLALQQGAFALAGELLPTTMATTIPLRPGFAAFALGLAVLFGFALPPLLRLREIEPMRVFRRDLPLRARRFDVLYLAPLALAAGLVWFAADSARLATTLALGLAGVAVVGLLLGALLLFGVRALSRGLSGAWRFGLANLARRRVLSLVQIVALALSVTALDLLAVVAPSLLDRWRAELPADTPNWFAINVQADQRAALETRLRALGADNLDLLPIATGKLVAINGHAPKAEDYEDRRAGNWIEGQVRVSWSETLPPSNALLEGDWFPQTTTGPQLSVDRVWSEMFGLRLGDRLTLRIAEREIEARVTSIRKVDWESFRVNFFLMLDPASGEGLPHAYLSSFHLPATAASALPGLSRAFPNLSLIDVNAILDRVREMIGRVSRTASVLLGFSFTAGILVLLAALAATVDERRREAALMRTLGATRRQLGAAALGEFAALGLCVGVVAALGAAFTGIALAREVFDMDAYAPPWAMLTGVALACAALFALLGTHATRRIARTPPLAVLRRV